MNGKARPCGFLGSSSGAEERNQALPPYPPRPGHSTAPGLFWALQAQGLRGTISGPGAVGGHWRVLLESGSKPRRSAAVLSSPHLSWQRHVRFRESCAGQGEGTHNSLCGSRWSWRQAAAKPWQACSGGHHPLHAHSEISGDQVASDLGSRQCRVPFSVRVRSTSHRRCSAGVTGRLFCFPGIRGMSERAKAICRQHSYK